MDAIRVEKQIQQMTNDILKSAVECADRWPDDDELSVATSFSVACLDAYCELSAACVQGFSHEYDEVLAPVMDDMLEEMCAVAFKYAERMKSTYLAAVAQRN